MIDVEGLERDDLIAIIRRLEYELQTVRTASSLLWAEALRLKGLCRSIADERDALRAP